MAEHDNKDFYNAVLSLQDVDACHRFFTDICTPKELQDLSDRLKVAKMLLDGKTYENITKATGMSSTTIARINRALLYGEGGYKQALEEK